MTGRIFPAHRHDSSPRFRDSPPDILRRPSAVRAGPTGGASAAVPFLPRAVLRCGWGSYSWQPRLYHNLIQFALSGHDRLIIAPSRCLSRYFGEFCPEILSGWVFGRFFFLFRPGLLIIIDTQSFSSFHKNRFFHKISFPQYFVEKPQF